MKPVRAHLPRLARRAGIREGEYTQLAPDWQE